MRIAMIKIELGENRDRVSMVTVHPGPGFEQSRNKLPKGFEFFIYDEGGGHLSSTFIHIFSVK